jgi:hypothetical protein
MSTLKPLLFQVCWALYVANRQLSFIHNDFHFGNILLKSMPKGKVFCEYEDDEGMFWYLETTMTAKISDFGLSTLRTASGEQILCKKIGSIGLDLAGLYLELKAMKISDNDEPEWLSFLRLLRSGHSNPREVLRHPFFRSFRDEPKDFDPNRALEVQSILGT